MGNRYTYSYTASTDAIPKPQTKFSMSARSSSDHFTENNAEDESFFTATGDTKRTTYDVTTAVDGFQQSCHTSISTSAGSTTNSFVGSSNSGTGAAQTLLTNAGGDNNPGAQEFTFQITSAASGDSPNVFNDDGEDEGGPPDNSSSSSFTAFGSTGFIGPVQGTGSTSNKTTHDSTHSIIELHSNNNNHARSQTEVVSYSKKSGSTQDQIITIDFSSSHSSYTSYSFSYEPRVVGSSTTSSFSYDGTSRTVDTTVSEFDSGGLSVTRLVYGKSNSGLSRTVAIYDEDGEFVSNQVDDPTTNGNVTELNEDSVTEAVETDTSFDGRKTVEEFTLKSGFSTVSSTEESRVASIFTTTKSTALSDVYGFAPSDSVNGNIKTYTTSRDTNNRFKSQTIGIVTTETENATNAFVSAAENREAGGNIILFTQSTIAYEGGAGAYSLTTTGEFTDDITFTSFNLTDVKSTLAFDVKNSGPVKTRSFDLVLTDSPDPEETDTKFTKTVSSSEEEQTVLTNTVTDQELTTIDFDDPESDYRSNGFRELTRETYDTITSNREFLIQSTTETTGDTTAETTVDNGVKDESCVEFETTQTGASLVTNSVTYFDYDASTISSLTTLHTKSATFTKQSYKRIGSHPASVSITSTYIDETTHKLTFKLCDPTIATYFSSVFGLRYISDTTSKISLRDNLNPPKVRYTEDFITSTTRSYLSESIVGTGTDTVRNLGTLSDTIYTTSSKTNESYHLPRAATYKLQGFTYVFRDDTLTIYDTIRNSISLSDGDDVMRREATFTGTFTTSLSDATEHTSSYSKNSVFGSIVENKLGATPVEAFKTVSLGTHSNNDNVLIFGGRQDYVEPGVIQYESDDKFTLVISNAGGSTTSEIDGGLNRYINSHSTVLDGDFVGARFFLSTKAEFFLVPTISTNDTEKKPPFLTYERYKDY